MKKIEYPTAQESVYVETLDNGLQVTLLPKKDYHKTYGLFTTNYGSIDNEFIPLGQSEFKKVPDGIAHFLEHKLFEKKAGDIFQVFGSQGASANAFTSFTRTSYLFSATSKITENVQTLLDFVQEPYFTEETVEKEKGIIGQEIQMYQDDANWRLLFGLLGNLYPKHPIHIDIAGTEASIAAITADDLYLCYRTFYHPSNMNLFIVGNFEAEALMDVIRTNQAAKEFAPSQSIERRAPEENDPKIRRSSSAVMAINRPKVLVGVRGLTPLPKNGRELLRYQITGDILVELLFGDTSMNQLELYNQAIIDDSFEAEFTVDRGFHFLDVGGDTEQPEVLVERLQSLLLNWKNSAELTPENLQLVKKKMIGKHVQSLNSLEYIANQFSQLPLADVSLFDLADIINQIQLEDVEKVAEALLQPKAISSFMLLPREGTASDE